MARASLTIFENKEPEGWRRFNLQALLGRCLAAQGKLVEAEPLLLSGYTGMKSREQRIPAFNRICERQALEALVKFYQDTGRGDEALKWNEKLSGFDKENPRRP